MTAQSGKRQNNPLSSRHWIDAHDPETQTLEASPIATQKQTVSFEIKAKEGGEARRCEVCDPEPKNSVRRVR